MEKEKRYQHIIKQLESLFEVTEFPISRMATISSILHNKMEGFFWTGFYLLNNGELLVGPYQGSLACQKLKKDTGVCWAGVNQKKTIVVPDVHEFPGHIACDSRSNSEIVIPVFNKDSEIFGVLDIDSKNFNQFDSVDAIWLEKIVKMI
ncbi:MAG: GAF domain-containing protein [Bacteroidia bacterium]|nr:GAF domain-containing protein [Bacteroidia bacterium]